MNRTRTQGAGLGLAVLSAATFGTSGSFATSLIHAGWTPAAAVTARIVIAALVMTAPALYLLRGRLSLVRDARRSVLVYGVVAVAGAQLCYFNAVQRLSVGIALLLEYLGILLVVGWMWVRHGHRPRRLTVVGAVASAVGLALVLDITGHQHLDAVGVLWGLGAAVGLAAYYLLSADVDNELPPIAMAWAGLVVGGVCLLLMGAAQVVPVHATTADVTLMHHRVVWVVPVLGLSLVAAVFAYVAGIDAARMLGARLASFVGLTEVLFAVLFAWILLGQLPRGIQLIGGLFIIGGVTLVRIDELRDARPAPSESAALVAVPN